MYLILYLQKGYNLLIPPLLKGFQFIKASSRLYYGVQRPEDPVTWKLRGSLVTGLLEASNRFRTFFAPGQ